MRYSLNPGSDSHRISIVRETVAPRLRERIKNGGSVPGIARIDINSRTHKYVTGFEPIEKCELKQLVQSGLTPHEATKLMETAGKIDSTKQFVALITEKKVTGQIEVTTAVFSL